MSGDENPTGEVPLEKPEPCTLRPPCICPRGTVGYHLSACPRRGERIDHSLAASVPLDYNYRCAICGWSQDGTELRPLPPRPRRVDQVYVVRGDIPVFLDQVEIHGVVDVEVTRHHGGGLPDEFIIHLRTRMRKT